MEVPMKELKERVRELRRKKGWAQEDLAREIGVSLSTIQRWENKGSNPTRLARRELKKLFDEAGITVDSGGV
jgi:transcriptional regulator with XRE-family HTH domain